MGGTILDANLHFCKKLGYSKSELITKNVKELLPEEYNRQFDKYLERIKSKGYEKGMSNVVTKKGRTRVVEYKNSLGQQNRIYQSQRLRYRDYEAGKSRRAYIYRNSDYDYRVRRLSAFFQDSIDLGKLSILASLRYDRQWGLTLPVTVPATNVDWAGEYNLPSVTTQARKSNVI